MPAPIDIAGRLRCAATHNRHTTAINTHPKPRWFALPLLALGALGFAAAWMLLALLVERQCAWLAPLAALDMVLLLRISGWPRGVSRAGWAVLATALVIALANFGIVAGQIGMSFGMRPWESALHIGPHYAWLLATLANDRIDLLLYAAGLLVALWTGWAGFSARRRPAPSVR
ncbi:MAG: hypothetical protein QM612_10995 [Thermomonas sp.]|uniref:hypothetical protein n=1 Tax=Thermomonas sp. TaxID=1971895 RepID=UPI0039E47BB4